MEWFGWVGDKVKELGWWNEAHKCTSQWRCDCGRKENIFGAIKAKEFLEFGGRMDVIYDVQPLKLHQNLSMRRRSGE